MELLPNWTLPFDPTVYTTDNAAVGLLAKWQRDLTAMRTTLLAGVDVDVSPGACIEDIVRPQTSASGLPSGRPMFSSYTTGARIYEYDVSSRPSRPPSRPTSRRRRGCASALAYAPIGCTTTTTTCHLA